MNSKIEIKNIGGVAKVCVSAEGGAPTELEVCDGYETCIETGGDGGLIQGPVTESPVEQAEEEQQPGGQGGAETPQS